MTITRRVFVKSGGLALFSLGFDPLFLDRAAYAAIRPTVRPSDRPTLVCLFQRGAVDGLNMIVPHGEELYYRERPRIAVPRAQVVDLDSLVPATADRDALVAAVNEAILAGTMSEHTKTVIRDQLSDISDPRQARALAIGLALGGPDFQRQ